MSGLDDEWAASFAASLDDEWVASAWELLQEAALAVDAGDCSCEFAGQLVVVGSLALEQMLELRELTGEMRRLLGEGVSLVEALGDMARLSAAEVELLRERLGS